VNGNTYKADPRFDPLRTAREMGSSVVPRFFLDGDAGAGSTDQAATIGPDLVGQIKWGRVLCVLLAVFLVWKLAK